MLVAVGVENDWTLAEFGFEAIRVELRLLLTDARVAPGSLRFDDAERLAVVAPEDIVDEAFARSVGHTLDRVFRVMARLDEGPAGFREQEVDEGVARGRFIVVVRVRRLGVGRLRRGHLRLQRLDLGIELLALGLRGEALLFGVLARFDGLGEAAGDLLQLRELGDGDRRRLRQGVGRESEFGVGLSSFGHRCARASRTDERVRAAR